MELKKYQNIMRAFSSLILILSFQFSFACIEGPTASEHTRIAIFEAQRNGFSGLTPFHYSSDRFYLCSNEDYFNNYDYGADKKLNCVEWQKELGSQIKVEDIYLILYKTNAKDFVEAYESKSLQKVFKNNTFINTLIQPKNKVFLNYILFAKKLEYNSRSWNLGIKYTVDVDNYKEKLLHIKNEFLKERYAFLFLRNSFYKDNSKEVIRLYNTYFAKKMNTILGLWALNYRSFYFTNKAYSNYLLSKTLASAKYKSYIILQNYRWDLTEETLALAKNNDERSVILSIENLQNPGPGFNEIKQIAKLSPNNLFLGFLIGREINKLEDWIYTPKYTGYDSSMDYGREIDWKNYEQSKKENGKKDILYLREFRNFLISIYSKTSGEQKDYVATAIAHLSFMDDQIDLGKKYTNMISNDANSSIQMQKNILLALLSLRQDDLKSKKVQDKLAVYFNSVEGLAKKDSSLDKCMYSLYLIASEEFLKRGDVMCGGLLSLKSYMKHQEKFPIRFNIIDYFDRNATVKDMDLVIELKQKKSKTPFEKFICLNAMPNDIKLLKDLKGTIAFRDNNLELAYNTFATIPKDFWEKNYIYQDHLNENPFVPKVLQKIKDRKYNYRFNKAEFLGKLIKLKKVNTAKSNLELAHAYFNVSFYGNSWMMISYYWYEGSGFDSKTENEKKYQKYNYYCLTIAKEYYQKALKMSTEKEEKALASLMIFKCNYANYKSTGFNSYDLNYFPFYNYISSVYPFYYMFCYPYYVNHDENFRGVKELINFYTIYKSTETFKKYNCPMLEEFIN